uniref:Integrase catalytic domain-containing protein n=1 Tax=Sparus aurata TaxID=8175 RepID=A0A671VNU5_SPAAU
MFGDIQQWCEQCVPCQTRRAPVPRHRAPMGGVQASRPFQRVATDILELPMTSKGSRYVLVVEDYFTKFVNLYALPNQTAQSVAQCLFDDYVLLHGIPEALHSDQGRQFESEIVQRLCQLLGITKTRTAPYNPKSDGMVERFNRTLISQLAKALLATGGEWDDYLKSVGFAYNTSVHASTGYTPFYLVHGREARVPVDVLVPSQRGRWGVFSSQGDYVTSLVEKLETAFGAARRSSTCAREKQKLYHDGTARHRPYAVGDLVWLRNPTEDRMKLAPHWKGPFRILAVLGSQEDGGDRKCGCCCRARKLTMEEK